MNTKKLNARMIALMGILIALIAILGKMLGIETQFLTISFSFVPTMIMGMLFGPLWTGIGCVLADFLGMALFAKSSFFIGFTFNAFLAGAIYGWFFYQKPVTLKRALGCVLTITLVINLCLTPIWLSIMYGQPLFSWVIWGPRLIKTAIFFPIQTGLVYFFGSVTTLDRIVRRAAIKLNS